MTTQIQEAASTTGTVTRRRSADTEAMPESGGLRSDSVSRRVTSSTLPSGWTKLTSSDVDVRARILVRDLLLTRPTANPVSTSGNTLALPTNADARHIRPTGANQPIGAGSVESRRRFIYNLICSLDLESVTDGFSHPAEQLIVDALEARGSEVLSWIALAYIDNNNTCGAVSADILRCIGRVRHPLLQTAGLLLAIHGLSHRDVEIREAAVRVLEEWGDADAVRLLQERVTLESDPSLRGYIGQVIRDLAYPI